MQLNRQGQKKKQVVAYEAISNFRNEKFRLYLREELLKRIARNPKYSIRAFAKALGIEPSSLSQILEEKRSLTDKMCLRLSNKLNLSTSEISELMGSYPDTAQASYQSVSIDAFKVISDWYHYAILELTHIDNFDLEPRKISKALGITLHEVRDAIERLKRLDFLEINENGKWVDRMGDAVNQGNEQTAPAFRRLQKQILEKAILALENIPYEKRVQTSMTIPVNLKQFKKGKTMCIDFVRKLGEHLREGSQNDEIYHLSVSLYPVTEIKKEQIK